MLSNKTHTWHLRKYCFLVGLLFNIFSYANTITVGGSCSLTEAIANANNDDQAQADCGAGSGTDTLVFASDQTLTLTTSPSINSSDLIIDGTGRNITIDGDSSGRLLVTNVTLDLINIEIINGKPGIIGDGGAIKNDNGTINVTDCTFSNNQANNGSAIYNDGGTVTITNSTFSNNQATTGNGGAIYNDNGTVTISHSTFSNNQATSGNGGGIYNTGSGQINLSDSSFSTNQANNAGGIDNNSGTITLESTAVTGNTATTANPDLQGSFTTNGGNIIGDNTGASTHFPDGLPNANGDYVGTASTPIVAYTLTLNTQGNGSINRSPTGATCGSNCLKYAENTSVSLTPNPASGSAFQSWSGHVNCANSFTLTQDMSCTAIFSASASSSNTSEHSLTIRQTGSGNGTVKLTPIGRACGNSCSQYPSGTRISLMPQPYFDSRFDGWVEPECSHSFLLNKNQHCTAIFTESDSKPSRPLASDMGLSVLMDGSGTGRVKSQPHGINCQTQDCQTVSYQDSAFGLHCDSSCSQRFKTATFVKLIPQAESDSVFDSWGGHPDCSDGKLFMINNILCVAFFHKLNRLTVAQAGDGTGNINSYNFANQATGIDCGNKGSECSKRFSSRSTVILKANPAPDSEFTGWGGDCEGGNPAIRLKMKAAKNCIAYFVVKSF
jgi:predicted outer membrane repeat protein